jgi:hypothetical protein
MPSKNCLTCGDEFSVVPSRADKAKFCSQNCYHEGQKQGKTSHPDRYVEYEELECTECSKTVEKPPSRANRSDRQFCDEECYINWSSSHQKKESGRRQRMREKENASCEICGFDRFIEMSHIVASENGGTYHKNNIAMLCPNHHRLLDHGKIKLEEIEKIENKIRRAVCDGDGWKKPEETDTFFEGEARSPNS